MYWLIVIVFVAILAFFVWASADIGSNVYLKTLCRAKTEDKVVALTFDDGPDAEMTPRVLDVLKEYGVKATFFLIGSNVDKNPEIVKRLVSEGHTIANHTYSHVGAFPLKSSEMVSNELQRCNSIIYQTTGLKPKLFRPPFGVTNPIIGNVSNSMRFKTVGWSIRSLDTIKSRSRVDVCNAILKRLHCGAIILLHDRCNDADVLLRILIPSIRERGYSITTIETLMKDYSYEN